MKDLMDLGLWNQDMRDKLKFYNGSIQNIKEIPEEVRNIYKTVWEIPFKALIDQSADRAPFIDQTQSLNIFIAEPTFQKIVNMVFQVF